MGLRENIKKMRLEAGMTLEDVAQQLNTSRQTIQRYESGVIANIPPDRIEQLAAALRTTPTELVGWTGNGPSTLSEMMQARYGESGEKLVYSLDRLNEQGLDEAAVRVEELSFFPRYQTKHRPPSDDWRKYAGSPVAARDGGVRPSSEKQARHASLLEQDLEKKGEL